MCLTLSCKFCLKLRLVESLADLLRPSLCITTEFMLCHYLHLPEDNWETTTVPHCSLQAVLKTHTYEHDSGWEHFSALILTNPLTLTLQLPWQIVVMEHWCKWKHKTKLSPPAKLPARTLERNKRWKGEETQSVSTGTNPNQWDTSREEKSIADSADASPESVLSFHEKGRMHLSHFQTHSH